MTIPVPRPEHPRPDFQRNDSDWMNLNGVWQFEFDDRNIGEAEGWQYGRELASSILVPYCYQSLLSGVYDTSHHDVVWYRQDVKVPEHFEGRRVLLHFGAVDYHSKVWVNGQRVGEHVGGYSPFHYDITDQLQPGSNTITVRVEDSSTGTSQPRGKQSWKEKNFGCWYTQVTGIWQTVWLEAVSPTRISHFKITPDIDTFSAELEAKLIGNYGGCKLQAKVTYKGMLISEQSMTVTRSNAVLRLDMKSDLFHWKAKLWTPERPNLYDVEIELIRDGQRLDQVNSYFGMRKISVKSGKIMLNNQPYYQKLVLNQGYYDGGLLTAARDEDYIQDIRYVKEFGFNGVRMHQKAEDPRFLYWADRLGILVWGEMGSPYDYTDDMTAANLDEWRRIIERDYNHPSLIVWTLMNESWGIPHIATDRKQQHHTLALYHMVKSYDATRLAISNDGWEHTLSDIATFHDYTQDGTVLEHKLRDKHAITSDPVGSVGNALGAKYLYAEGFSYGGQPVVLSECCGVAYLGENGWGYGKNVSNEVEFVERYRDILTAIHRTGWLAGYCATQLTDVEQEINGLLTIDRRPKVDPKLLAEIIRYNETIELPDSIETGL